MNSAFQKLAFTPSVLAAQHQYNGRVAGVPAAPVHPAALAAEEIEFIKRCDSFYIASVSETGWPYIQHRGGPHGFLRVLDEHTLGFSDFGGNRQLISVGNLTANDRVTLFLMDYNRGERLKILGHARIFAAKDNAGLAAKLSAGDYAARVERLFLIEVVAFDWNCSQHISARLPRS